MKKLIALILILTMCLCAVSCAAEKAQPTGSEDASAPEVAPELTPEPPKTIVTVTDAEQAELFLNGADTVLAECGYELMSSALADYSDADAAAIVAYLTQENADTAQLAAAVQRGRDVRRQRSPVRSQKVCSRVSRSEKVFL